MTKEQAIAYAKEQVSMLREFKRTGYRQSAVPGILVAWRQTDQDALDLFEEGLKRHGEKA